MTRVKQKPPGTVTRKENLQLIGSKHRLHNPNSRYNSSVDSTCCSAKYHFCCTCSQDKEIPHTTSLDWSSKKLVRRHKLCNLDRKTNLVINQKMLESEMVLAQFHLHSHFRLHNNYPQGTHNPHGNSDPDNSHS